MLLLLCLRLSSSAVNPFKHTKPKSETLPIKYILYITADYSLVEIQQFAYQGAVKRVERDILHFFLVSLKFAVGYTKLYSFVEKKMKMNNNHVSVLYCAALEIIRSLHVKKVDAEKNL